MLTTSVILLWWLGKPELDLGIGHLLAATIIDSTTWAIGYVMGFYKMDVIIGDKKC